MLVALQSAGRRQVSSTTTQHSIAGWPLVLHGAEHATRALQSFTRKECWHNSFQQCNCGKQQRRTLFNAFTAPQAKKHHQRRLVG